MKKLFITMLCLLASPVIAADDLAYPKPNLSETNIRDTPKNNPNAGSPTDYLLIPITLVAERPPKNERYLRFDMQVTEVRVDDPLVLTAAVSGTDPRTVILRPQGYGSARVLIFGALPDDRRDRILYDASVAVGTRMVTYRHKGAGEPINREVLDCTPVCVPSPANKPREPDQIIENRGVTVNNVNAAPVAAPR